MRLSNRLVLAGIHHLGPVALLLALLTAGEGIRAAPVLTSAAQTGAWSLSLFADSFPSGVSVSSGSLGPLGLAFTGNPNGELMVADSTGVVRVFPSNADGQHANLVPSVSPPASANTTMSRVGLATVGNHVFAANQWGNRIARLNLNGTWDADVAFLSLPTALAFNAVDGNLYISTAFNGIYRLNPNTNQLTSLSFSILNVLAANYDGMLVSPDGQTLYAARDNYNNIPGAVEEVVGWNLVTGAQVFASGFHGSGPDGITLGSGILAGSMFVNYNDGSLWEIDMSNPSNATQLVAGGTRGDLTMVDGCSILFTQSDSIWRLSAPSGGCFSVATVPEPSAASLVILSMGALWVARRRRSED